ncbi:MAG: sulfite exporter TauE/SafE family protein [Elusimicrobia bacterium]|nr:sulfite exporter TauE/SafE family protein [Elusimicrobiota bacterium]
MALTGLIAEGLGLGLSTGLYCLGACAPVLVPYLLAEEPRFRRDLMVVGQFLLGRLAAYLLLAVVVGLAGARLTAMPGWVTGPALLVCGLVLLGYAFMRGAPRLDACARASASPAVRNIPLLMGFLVGINLCPPFMAGLVRLATIGSVAGCVAYFTAFFAGTTVYVLPVLLAAPLKSVERLRAAAAIACGLSGLWFAGLGLAKLLRLS